MNGHFPGTAETIKNQHGERAVYSNKREYQQVGVETESAALPMVPADKPNKSTPLLASSQKA